MASKSEKVKLSPLDAFLISCEVSKGSPTTHTRIPGGGMPAGSYNIPPERLDEFYKLYYDEAFLKGKQFSFTETTTPTRPALVDLDFHFEHTITKHQFKMSQIKTFVEHWCYAITDVLEIAKNFEIFVMLKDRPVLKSPGVASDGVHIMIPEVCMGQNVQQHVREVVLPKLEEIFGTMNHINRDWNTVYDKSVFRGQWQLYGSQKPEGRPYKVVHKFVWDYDSSKIIEDTPLDSDFETIENIKKLSSRNIDQAKCPELSDVGKQILGTTETKKIAPPTSGFQTYGKSTLSEESLIEIVAHVMNIKNDSTTEYDLWYKLGQALFNLGPTDEVLYKAWLDWSRKSPKHDEKACEKAWSKFTRRQDGERVSSGTIRYMSKISNPEHYKEIQADSIHTMMINSAYSQAEYDVARIMHKMYGEYFKCISPKDRVWYVFEGHMWVESKDGMAVRSLLSTEIFDKFATMATKYSLMRDQQPADSEEYEKFDDIRERLETIRTKLKKTSFKENVMKECSEVFFDGKFFDNLDKSTMLLGCLNGVFDMNTMDFRNGRPEDMISKSTQIEYDPSKHWTDVPHADELIKFLKDIQPDDAIREYLLDFMCSTLCGVAYDELFHIMTGGGGNGKSLLFEAIMSAVLGEYYALLPVSVATKKRGKSNEASPELLKAKGARLLVLKEPDDGDGMNAGAIKDLTPGDRVYCRPLRKDPVEFILQAKLILMCNDKPKMNAKDGGLMRRLRVIFFGIQFVDEPTEKNHRIKDGTLKRRIGTWAPALLALLIQRYIAKKGVIQLKPIKEIMEYTEEYRRENDGIAKFYADCISIDNESFTIPYTNKSEINFVLREWKRENTEFGTIKIDDVINFIKKKHGEPEKAGWKYMRCRNPYMDS
jgi:P4 family phage/plasmid primase-like protien